MVLTGHPITIYGKGEQRKPQISLEDCVQSNVNALRLPLTGEFKVYNQTTEIISIVDIAQAIVAAARELGLAAELTHIENPRVEKEEHQMLMDTTNFSQLLPNPVYTVASGARQMLKALLPYREILVQYRDRFLSV
jgi:nucleoside-diphosphate-sugar epimerase